jgi:acetyl esterase
LAIDPEIRIMMDAALAAGGKPVAELPLELSRQAYSQRYRERSLPAPEGVSCQRLEIPGPGKSIPACFYRPHEAQAALPLLVYFHGGGFVLGDAAGYHGQNARLANEIGCALLFPEFRLAPEHPFPAALDDALATVNWAAKNAAALNIDAARLAVAGDSAGGNLAGNIGMASRDGTAPPLALQALFYPVTDYRPHFSPHFGDPSYPSLDEFAKGYWLDRTALDWFAHCYLQSPDDVRNPRASLILTDDFADLPPALVVTAAYDPLRDMGAAYAERLTAAGCDAAYWCADGMIHNFLGHTAKSQAAHSAFLRIVQIIKQRFQGD